MHKCYAHGLDPNCVPAGVIFELVQPDLQCGNSDVASCAVVDSLNCTAASPRRLPSKLDRKSGKVELAPQVKFPISTEIWKLRKEFSPVHIPRSSAQKKIDSACVSASSPSAAERYGRWRTSRGSRAAWRGCSPVATVRTMGRCTKTLLLHGAHIDFTAVLTEGVSFCVSRETEQQCDAGKGDAVRKARASSS